MAGIPTLTIHFDLSDECKQVELELTCSENTTPVTCSLVLPFSKEEIPLVLRALDARQYPDYPHRERLIKSTDDRSHIISTLQKLGLWDGDETTGAVVTDVPKRVGIALGKALLEKPTVQSCLSSLYERAKVAQAGEIVLHFSPNATALAALPWEVTYHGSQPMLLAHGVVLNCTRVILSDKTLRLSPELTEIEPLLRVLTITPQIGMNESDRAFEQNARYRMREALSSIPLVTVEDLSPNTMLALYKRLAMEPRIHVLDYFGHGDMTNEGAALILEHPEGGRDAVIASRLAVAGNLPSLIVLHACHSAQVDMQEPLTGIALALSDAGVRAVVAMQLTIQMAAVANVAVPIFYQQLIKNKSVQQAVAAVRQVLYAGEPDGMSWYVPTLYVHQPTQEPFVLLSPSAPCPPNPFASLGALEDATRFIGREEEMKKLWEQLKGGGNLSIIGSTGSGKSTSLTLIQAKYAEILLPDIKVIRLPLTRKVRLAEAQQALGRMLGKAKANADEVFRLLEDRHMLLLLDDLGQLDKGERGLDVRLWLKELSQDRTSRKVQLVTTSLRPLGQIFKDDESPDFSALHHAIDYSITLGTFSQHEAEAFITQVLQGTPFHLQDFTSVLTRPVLPDDLRKVCRARYDELCNVRSIESRQ